MHPPAPPPTPGGSRLSCDLWRCVVLACAGCPQVVEGLVHCQARGVWHLDIKPDNILVCEDGCVKVADFGCATLTRHNTQRCGTPEYACPEAVHAKVTAQSQSTTPSPTGETVPVVAVPVPLSTCVTPTPPLTPSASSASGVAAPESPRACSGAPGRDSDSASARSHGAVARACAPLMLDADKADVWALGVTMAACTFGNFPWSLAHPTDAAYNAWQSAWTYILGTAVARADDGVAVVDTGRAVSSREARVLGHLLLQCCGAMPEAAAPAGGSAPQAHRASPVSPCMLDLLVRMLDPRPEARLSMAQVAAHEWVVGVPSACC